MALMKTINLFSSERPVVEREQMRSKYSSLEYLLSKAIAELPLDVFFAAAFTTMLKAMTGLRIPLTQLTATFSLMTVAGAALGFAIGSSTPTAESAMSLGIPGKIHTSRSCKGRSGLPCCSGFGETRPRVFAHNEISDGRSF